MSYRIFRLCIAGPYFERFFEFADSLGNLSFDAAMQRCRESGFLYPGRFKAEMERHGVDVMEALVDVPALQKKWLDENGGGVFSKEDAVLRQMKAFKPDIVFFQTFLALSPEVRRRIKEECPSVRIVCGHRGFPIDDCTGYEDVDAAFLGYPRFHDRWHAVGVRTFFHLHCFDEGLLPEIRRRASEMEAIPFSFIGTTGWGFGPHDGRYYDLRRVLDATDLTVFGNEPPSAQQPLVKLPGAARMHIRKSLIETAKYLPDAVLKLMAETGARINFPIMERGAEAALRRKRFGPEVAVPQVTSENFWYHKEKPIRELYPERIHPSRVGLEYFATLAASDVTWNRHLEMEGAGANMRLFEACGAGTCQLVDYRDEVVQAFEPDVEIAVYRSIDECIEKARWLRDHPAERKAIAAAGQARALKDHSVAQRAAGLHEHFLELLRSA